jgi:hypothetical protein
MGSARSAADRSGYPAAPLQFLLRVGSLRGRWRRYRAPRRATYRRPGVCAQCAALTPDAAAAGWYYTPRNVQRFRHYQLCPACAWILAAPA